YRRALEHFRTLLQELIAGAIGGSTVAREPVRATRNPLTKLRRWFDREPGFEELVGKYASLLPVLERPSGVIYTDTATIGIEALRARRLEISETVYEEVRYRTSTSAALATVMKGVGVFLGLFLILAAIIPAIAAGIANWMGVPPGEIAK